MCVSLRVQDPDQDARIRKRYAAFVSETTEPEVRIGVRVEEGDDFLPVGPGPFLVVEAERSKGRLTFTSRREQGIVDFPSGKGYVILRPAAEIENYLRVLYAWLCLDHGALLVHSAGVVRNGQAVVFFGPSGSGKTTIAKLSRDHTVLSDDLVVVKKDNGVYSAHGVPFRGAAWQAPRTNASGELHGLFRLRKSTEHRVRRMVSSRAFGELVASVPFVANKDNGAIAVMGIAEDIVKAVPVAELCFRKDQGFWSVLDDYC